MMLKIGRQSQVTVRLPKMSGIPGAEDLQFLLTRAQRNWRQPVELSFSPGTNPESFTIVVQCEMMSGIPQWGLFVGDEPEAPLAWTHDTADVHLIHSLLTQACTSSHVVTAREEQDISALTNIDEGDQVQVCDGSNYSALSSSVSSSRMAAHEELTLDQAAISSVVSLLSRPETGVFTFPAFQYFLEQEFLRFQRGGLPFSVILFEMAVKSEKSRNNREPLPLIALREAVSRILTIKRSVDQLAHGCGFELACLLLQTDATGAAIFARRIERALKAKELAPGIADRNVVCNFGVASIPDDAMQPGLLLIAAREAKERAITQNVTVVSYRELRTPS